ncbi:MAG: 16S rRNA (guanine(527)-N(7))-methyltransferase RsmG [Clostridia bacterium]|nr:16S rRNA (guanine(527)-N(7))-methyltransferase RsmG [Clostridia bacterium]
MINKEFFYDSAKEIGIELNDEQIDKFDEYKSLLLEWNEKINLTAILTENDFIIKHFVDSLTCLKYLSNKNTLLDIGTGAGFPGVPLKIMRDDINVTLLDSLNKRIIYLQDVIDKLKLNRITAIHGRAEEFGKNKDYREKFDVVTARAVANMRVLAEYSLPFVKVGGTFIAMKGSNVDEELEEAREIIKKLGAEINSIEKVTLHTDEEILHHVVEIKKVRNTPIEFPRRIVK